MRLGTRVEKLEAESGAGRVTVMFENYGETKEQTVERWKREHPGQEPDELSAILVRWSDPQELALAAPC